MPLPKPVLIVVLLQAAFLGGCALYVPPQPAPRSASTRDQYENGVLRSDLSRTADYAAWSEAGRRALRDRLSVRPSFRELLHFPAGRATAVGYRIELRRGQRVDVTLDRRSGARVFAEIFEEIGPGDPIFRLVRSAQPHESRLSFEAVTDGPHVLRLQPELYKGSELLVTVTTAAALTFPVSGKTSRAIGSRFGEPRDGGKRDHEGIDIFAPAGTPVIAVAPGIIAAVHTTSIGGKVVWQEDRERGVTYYYAHLESQSVRIGDRVNAGDEIGKVGNTGNARSTPSHLHFSVYKPGRLAIDPVPFLYDQPADAVQPLLVDLAALGDRRAVLPQTTTVRMAPEPNAPAVMSAQRSDELFVIGGVGTWYRVLANDGRAGFVRASELGTSYSVKGSRE